MGIFKSASVLPITRSVISQGIDPGLDEAANGLMNLGGSMKATPVIEAEPVAERPRIPKPARQALHILNGFEERLTNEEHEHFPHSMPSFQREWVKKYVAAVKKVLESGDYSS